MPIAAIDDVTLDYEVHGEPGAPAVLLVMGLGMPAAMWPDEFVRTLLDRGLRVVTFDNRDSGASTRLARLPVPNIGASMTRAMMGLRVTAPYSLTDMAIDAVAVLDAAGIDRAHVIGASMGGMIAQTVAILYPDRVLSLTSIMSTTGDPTLPPATPEAMRVLLTPPPGDREGNVGRALEAWKVIGSPGYPFDEPRMRDLFGRAFDRGYNPGGVARQFAAIMKSGDRTTALRNVTVPSLVIHGAADPLIPVAAAHATASAISGAELLVIEGMGHDFPRGTWPPIIAAIGKHAARATAQAA